MITPQMNRCKYCSCCVKDDDGNWICNDCGKEIDEISDDECPAEKDW